MIEILMRQVLMNGCGEREHMRLLFIQQCSDAAPQSLLKHMRTKIWDNVQQSQCSEITGTETLCNVDPVALTSTEGLSYAGGCHADKEKLLPPGDG